MHRKGDEEMKKEINILRLLLLGAAVLIAAAVLILSRQADYDDMTEARISVIAPQTVSWEEYTLQQRDDQWIAAGIDYFREDTADETVVDEAFVEGIRNVLEENKAHRWNRFHLKYEFRKMMGSIETDGPTYRFYLHFSDGRTVEIDQYNACPDTFWTVFSEFEKRYEVLCD